MLKTIAFAIAACGVAVVSAAIPHTAAVATDVRLDEPGAMLLMATALFGLASVVRRHGKGAGRP
jgi:hypothetical protein